MSEDVMKEVVKAAPNRRSFVQKLGLAGAALGAAASVPHLEAQSSSTPTDTDILNFALNLEYLEADFYNVASSGQTIDQLGVDVTGSGTAGATTGGSQITWSDPLGVGKKMAAELAQDELAHVQLLRSAIQQLGGQPIARPAINLNALGFGFGSEADFLTLSRIFEDIGVTAYGGAAPLIKSSTILGVAARILAVEAEHSGSIRTVLSALQETSNLPPLDGADILPPPAGTKFFSTNNYALTETRTPGQVLYLAYGGTANATSGGFFPKGVNGSINAASATPAAYDGATLTASPNPIPANGAAFGQTTISWTAPLSQLIEIRVGAPNGPLFTYNYPTGSAMTGPWVTDGLTLYLQDVSGNKPLVAANTLATLVLHLA
jgi:hypothetical protein